MYTARTAFNDDGAESGVIVVNDHNEIQAAIRFIDTPFGKDGALARDCAYKTMEFMAELMNKSVKD